MNRRFALVTLSVSGLLISSSPWLLGKTSVVEKEASAHRSEIPSTSEQTNIVIVPESVQSGFGDTLCGVFSTYVVYAPVLFASLPDDVCVITEIAFRWDEAKGDVPPQSWGHVDISLGTLSGGMEQFVANPGTVPLDAVLVFSNDHTVLSGRSGQSQEFHLRFPLQRPYAYDRRLGPLALEIHPGLDPQIDAQNTLVFRGVPQEGAVTYVEPLGLLRIRAVVIATQFSYVSRTASIDRAEIVDGSIRLIFHVNYAEAKGSIETSDRAAGPYGLIATQIEKLDEFSFRASVSATNRLSFFRVRLD